MADLCCKHGLTLRKICQSINQIVFKRKRQFFCVRIICSSPNWCNIRITPTIVSNLFMITILAIIFFLVVVSFYSSSNMKRVKYVRRKYVYIFFFSLTIIYIRTYKQIPINARVSNRNCYKLFEIQLSRFTFMDCSCYFCTFISKIQGYEKFVNHTD